MFENITIIDLKIISLYIKDYKSHFSIRQITQKLNINYSHAFKRVKKLVEENILIQKKEGQANHISLNIQNIKTIQIISFVEEQESKKLKNTTLRLLIKEAIQIDPLACLGIFGSRVSGKATKDSDWDVFIITQAKKKKESKDKKEGAEEGNGEKDENKAESKKEKEKVEDKKEEKPEDTKK